MSAQKMTIAILLLLVATAVGKADTQGKLSQVDGMWTIRAVVSVEGRGADELFASLEDVMADLGIDDDEVAFRNQKLHRVRGEVCIGVEQGGGQVSRGDVLCGDLTLEARDGRVRYTLDKLTHAYEPGGGSSTFEKEPCLRPKYIEKKKCQKHFSVLESHLQLVELTIARKLELAGSKEDW